LTAVASRRNIKKKKTSTNSLNCIKTAVSLLRVCSQQPTTCPYIEPYEFSQHPPMIFKIHFNIIFPSCQAVSFLQAYSPNTRTYLYCVQRVPYVRQSHSPLYYNLNNIWCALRPFLLSPATSSISCPNTHFSTPFPNTLWLSSSHNFTPT